MDIFRALLKRCDKEVTIFNARAEKKIIDSKNCAKFFEYISSRTHSKKQGVDTLIDVDPRVEKMRLESRLESLENSKSILVLVDRAMMLLKNYPIEGQKYHDILTKTYMVFVKYSEIEIIEALNISRSTLYRDKKKAINLLGVILWGFVIPDLKNQKTN